jgi:hypothetical protein
LARGDSIVQAKEKAIHASSSVSITLEWNFSTSQEPVKIDALVVDRVKC